MSLKDQQIVVVGGTSGLGFATALAAARAGAHVVMASDRPSRLDRALSLLPAGSEGHGAKLPVGHIGEPAEVAETFLYLTRQTYCTGQMVTVDGGGVPV